MRKHRLEVADVIREYGEEFLRQWGHTVSPQQRKALHDIGVCRTAALGGHVERCDGCGHHQHEMLTGVSLRICPHCHRGSMLVVEVIPRPGLLQPVPDTS